MTDLEKYLATLDAVVRVEAVILGSVTGAKRGKKNEQRFNQP